MDQEKRIIPKRKVSGELRVPGSKSYAQRALALSALSSEQVSLNQLTECDDVVVAMNIVSSLGAEIQRSGSVIDVKGSFNKDVSHDVNCGEAGLSTRLFSAFSLLTDREFIVRGSGSILSRPMNMVEDALMQLGKQVDSDNGKLPLKITGKTSSSELNIDGSTSSQLLTGLLVVAPFLPFDLTIKVNELKSIPYIEMTINVLNDFGLSVENDDFKLFKIKGGQTVKRTGAYSVEGDWSGASFLIVAALIGGSAKLKGLNKESLQADRAIMEVVTKVGGNFEWASDGLFISNGNLVPFTFDATHCPDLFPPLVALAAAIEGESRITGVHRLQHKESDRAAALIKEFNHLGIDIYREGDELVINGLNSNELINGGIVDSHNDHRMAMALTLMSLRSNEEILIINPESIKKSYPLFFEDFERIST
jgi:3-phosphoshikimate 1-carboxyvinyltransferase